MKKATLLIVTLALVLGAFLVGGCLEPAAYTPANSGQIIEDIGPQAALDLIQQSTGSADLVILDVRSADKVAQGYIAGAINLDYRSASFESELESLDKDKAYIVYCTSGVHSGKTLVIMADIGFTEVYNLAGGAKAWQAAGLQLVVIYEATGTTIDDAFLTATLDDNGLPVGRAVVFSPDTARIYLFLNIQQDLTCTTFAIQWWRGDEKISYLSQDDFYNTPSSATNWLNQPDGGFIRGDYSVQVIIDSVVVALVSFSIE